MMIYKSTLNVATASKLGRWGSAQYRKRIYTRPIGPTSGQWGSTISMGVFNHQWGPWWPIHSFFICNAFSTQAQKLSSLIWNCSELLATLSSKYVLGIKTHYLSQISERLNLMDKPQNLTEFELSVAYKSCVYSRKKRVYTTDITNSFRVTTLSVKILSCT